MMKMRVHAILILLILFLLAACQKEETSVTRPATPPQQEETLLRSWNFLEEKNHCRLYSFQYQSVDINGEEIVLSAAMIVPKLAVTQLSEGIPQVILACHISLFDKEECPSFFSVNGKSTEMSGLVQKRNSLIIVPDYEGYGVSADRKRPYVVKELSGRQCADALLAGMDLYRKLSEKAFLPRLAAAYRCILMGYSQGATTALSTQQYLEQQGLDTEVHLKGTVCGGAPTDLLETMKALFRDFGGRSDNPFTIAMVATGFCDCLPEMKEYSAEVYFSKAFIDTGLLEWLQSGLYSVSEMMKMTCEHCKDGYTAPDGTLYSAEQARALFPVLEKKALSYSIEADLKEMLSPQCYAYLSETDLYQLPESGEGPLYALHKALYENSFLGGWEPRHSILMLHSTEDRTISFSNTKSFTEHHPLAPVRVKELSDGDHILTGTQFYIREVFSNSDFDSL